MHEVERKVTSIRGYKERECLKRAAEREVLIHQVLKQSLDTSLPRRARLFPRLKVDRVVKAYCRLINTHPALTRTMFHSTKKWFITQFERTDVPEHYTATLVGPHSVRSPNKLTYTLNSQGVSYAQKREIVYGLRLPHLRKDEGQANEPNDDSGFCFDLCHRGLQVKGWSSWCMELAFQPIKPRA